MNNIDVENGENLDTRMYLYTYFETTCMYILLMCENFLKFWM